MKKFHQISESSGQLVRLEVQSELLKGNPWIDTTLRHLNVYLPAGYSESSEPLPVFWDLAAYTNSGLGHSEWKNFGENLPERLQRLIHQGDMGPVVLVMPDCYTRLGGNQYLDSKILGPWMQHVHDELLPVVEEQFNVIKGGRGRAVFGKSSGAFGALMFAMHRPDDWTAVAAHAPDCAFDLVYRPDFPKAALTLARHNGDLRAFYEDFWQKEKVSGNDIHTLMLICLAATYDDDAEFPVLPFNLETLETDQERWARWLANDPLILLQSHSEKLEQLSCLHIDAGRYDQYNIQFGVRRIHRELERLGIAHTYEEFDGSHHGMDFRLDVSLPLMYKAIVK